MTTREHILTTLSKSMQPIKEYGVAHISVFGSAMRTDCRPDSDVDILVEFSEPAKERGYFDRFFGLSVFLESLLGRHVDLVTPDMLSGRRGAILRPHVEKDLVRVA